MQPIVPWRRWVYPGRVVVTVPHGVEPPRTLDEVPEDWPREVLPSRLRDPDPGS